MELFLFLEADLRSNLCSFSTNIGNGGGGGSFDSVTSSSVSPLQLWTIDNQQETLYDVKCLFIYRCLASAGKQWKNVKYVVSS